MEEKLTWEEIKRRFPDEWVILLDYEEDDTSIDIRTGIVFAHSSNKKELLTSTKEALSGKGRAIRYTGDISAGNYIF